MPYRHILLNKADDAAGRIKFNSLFGSSVVPPALTGEQYNQIYLFQFSKQLRSANHQEWIYYPLPHLIYPTVLFFCPFSIQLKNKGTLALKKKVVIVTGCNKTTHLF